MHHIWEVGGRTEFIVRIFGSEVFCKGINVPRRMVGAILAQNFRDFYGVSYERVGIVK